MQNQTISARARIDSWKGIAAFLGRDRRTVQRWEKERSLPVHRVPGERGTIFAYEDELLRWLDGAGPDPNPEPVETAAQDSGEIDAAEAAAQSSSATPAYSDATPQPPAIPDTPQTIPPRVLWSAGAVCALLLTAWLLFHVHTHGGGNHRANQLAASAPVAGASPAHELCLKGQFAFERRTPDGLRMALDAFQQARTADPTYAPAYIGLAETYELLPEFTSMPISEAFPQGLAAARTAVQLDPGSADAHRVLAYGLFYWEWKTSLAFSEFQRSLQIDPGNAQTHHWFATALLTLRDREAAEREIRAARELDPTSESILADGALIQGCLGGDIDHSLATLRDLERIDPHFVSAPRYMLTLLFLSDRFADWAAELRKIADTTHRPSDEDMAAAAERGWRGHDRNMLLEQLRAAQERAFARKDLSPTALVYTCTLLGDYPAAVRFLNDAYSQRDYGLLSFLRNPLSERLRGTPGFDHIRDVVQQSENSTT